MIFPGVSSGLVLHTAVAWSAFNISESDLLSSGTSVTHVQTICLAFFQADIIFALESLSNYLIALDVASSNNLLCPRISVAVGLYQLWI